MAEIVILIVTCVDIQTDKKKHVLEQICVANFIMFVMHLFCYALLSVLSSFPIILTGKRELVVLLWLSSRCYVTVNVVWLFLTMPWAGLQCVIVVFPDHSRLLFYIIFNMNQFCQFYVNLKVNQHMRAPKIQAILCTLTRAFVFRIHNVWMLTKR